MSDLEAEVTKWRLLAYGETLRADEAQKELVEARAALAMVKALADYRRGPFWRSDLLAALGSFDNESAESARKGIAR